MQTTPPSACDIKGLSDAVTHESAMEIFETDDLNFERRSKILVAIKSFYAYCREIYHEKNKTSSVKTSLNSYIKKPQQVLHMHRN
jgi:hypothetical protein